MVVSPEEFDLILRHVKDTAFKELIFVSYDSGARPFEVKELEARHVEVASQRAVIPADEAKGRRAPRVIYFPTDRSLEIVRRLCHERPDGKLFVNNRGRPWTAFAVKNRFEDVEVSIGIEEMRNRGIASAVTREAVEEVMKTLPKTTMDKAGKEVPRKVWQLRQQAKEKLLVAEAREYGLRFHHYALRHSRVTDWLISGVDSHVVAKLSGHHDTKMLDKVYSHVQDDYAFMLENAKKGNSSGFKRDVPRKP